jgi:hypothetical protein
MRLLTIAAIAALSVGVGTGCFTEKQVKSGFLGDNYSLMKPVDNDPKHLAYVDVAALQKYNAFMVDPVAVRIAPDAPGFSIDPKDLQQLADYMRGQIIKEGSKYFQYVEAPGPGVARIKAAITGVTKGEPAMNVLPQTKLTGVGLGGAAYESEVVDSQTGQLIQCSMNASKGDLTNLEGGLQVWGNARALLDKWIKEGTEQTLINKGMAVRK